MARRRIGIEFGRALGRYQGGKPKADVQAAKALKAQGLTIPDIAQRLKVSTRTIYNYLKK